MRFRGALGAGALVAVLVAALARAEEPAAWDPARTHALLVGVLEWKDPSLASFPKDGRQDRVLERTLKARGVPEKNVRFLEDKGATRAAIHQELEELAGRAGDGSTLVFYFAGHGLREDGGKTYLANYDVDTSATARTGFAVAELQRVLHEKFKGSRVLLFADCCHSGALGDVALSFEKEPRVRAGSLTSATASNISTGRWTFTESLVQVFAPDPGVDLDRDKTVTFGEADEFIHREMRWKETQLSRGTRTRSFEAGFAFGAVARPLPKLDGPFAIRGYAECQWQDDWWAVQIKDVKDGKYHVHYLGYPDSDDEWVAAGRLRLPQGLGYKTGEPCEVEWKKKWWPAKVLEVQDCFAFVKYDGFGPEWNEWVTQKRLKKKGEASGEKKRKKR